MTLPINLEDLQYPLKVCDEEKAMKVDEVLNRATSQIGLGMKYKMGGGTYRAAKHTCADDTNSCD